MTREEAIARIKDHIEIHRYDEQNAVKIFEALDMAIKALEQPEPCEDAVSRQVAIDTLLKWMRPICINNNGEVVESDDMVAIRNILKSLPPVQPERKVSARKGHWVKHDTGHSVYFDCSLCGCLAPCTETEDKFIWKLSNYCPDCGARLIEDRGAERREE